VSARFNQLFGLSPEMESSWQDALSEAHRNYILAFIEREQATEAVAIDQFLAWKQEVSTSI
jgi:hypothetical protein